MIAYKRVWEYLRLQNLSALATVDPLVLRAVRDNSTGYSLLHKAAFLGSENNIIDHLIQVGHCDVDAVDHIGQTPLHVAVEFHNLDTAKRLMEYKADVSIQDMSHRTPLHSASRDAIDFLLGRPTLETTGAPVPLLVPSQWEIHPDELQRQLYIGEGASGRVYSGLFKETPVAIKELIVPESSALASEFKKEVDILTKLRHPNLVLFMGVSTSSSLLLITELCSGGSIHSFLHDRNNRFTPKQIVRACIDTAAGLVYLHSAVPPILHMDLKSQNLLLQFDPTDDFLRVKIADFGTARIAQSPQLFAGTWWWMSPEALFGEEISDKSDMYSFGMCMYEIMSGKMPYEDVPEISQMPPVTVAIKVSEGLRPDINGIPPEVISVLPDLIALMKRCWNNDPKLRPTAREALLILQNHTVV
jgi:hypothetical protein